MRHTASTTTSFARSPFSRSRFPRLEKTALCIKAVWRSFRTSHFVTKLVGPQYSRSRDKIEIDITYRCNLACLNCNRSIRQAPQKLDISFERIESFVTQSISTGKRWKRIRILGGEPTLHPQFRSIIDELQRYKTWYPHCVIEVVSNGYGDHVNEVLSKLPSDIWIENSRKTGNVQPDFGPFNAAPIDDPKFKNKAFSNGCAIIRDCGMGLTPNGYYPCAVAGGIDRIIKENFGQDSLPDDSNDMLPTLERCCSLCGRFRDGHYVPKNLRPKLTEEVISNSWETIYRKWKQDQKLNRDS